MALVQRIEDSMLVSPTRLPGRWGTVLRESDIDCGEGLQRALSVYLSRSVRIFVGGTEQGPRDGRVCVDGESLIYS